MVSSLSQLWYDYIWEWLHGIPRVVLYRYHSIMLLSSVERDRSLTQQTPFLHDDHNNNNNNHAWKHERCPMIMISMFWPTQPTFSFIYPMITPHFFFRGARHVGVYLGYEHSNKVWTKLVKETKMDSISNHNAPISFQIGGLASVSPSRVYSSVTTAFGV